MEQILSYAVKTVICSGAFYLVYRLALDRRTGYGFCRVYLILGTIMSLVIPALTFKVYPGRVVEVTPEMLTMLSAAVPEATQPAVSAGSGIARSWLPISIMVIYCCVSLFFIGALFMQFIRINRYKNRAKKSRMHGITIYENNRIGSAFTFFRTVFIPAGLRGEEREQVIIHEADHARRNHSAELLLMEIMKCYWWFNPFLWLSRRSLAEVHEYQADNAVLEKGYDVHYYKDLLLRQLLGYSPDISNGFAVSKTKKRLIMMNKNRPGPRSFLRAVAVLPVTGALVMLFSFTTQDTTLVYTGEIQGDAIGEVSHTPEPAQPLELFPLLQDTVSAKSEPDLTGPEISGNINETSLEELLQSVTDKFFSDQGTTPEEYFKSMAENFYSDQGTTPEEYFKSMAEKFYSDQGMNPEEYFNAMVDKFYSDQGTTPEEYFKSMAENFEGKIIPDMDSFEAAMDGFLDNMAQMDIGLRGVMAEGLRPLPEGQSFDLPDLGTMKRDIKLLMRQMEEMKNQMEELNKMLDKMPETNVDSQPEIRQIRFGGPPSEDDKIFIYIDGEESQVEIMKKLDPSQIESISVIKNPDLLTEYGKEDYDGIIFIKTKGAEGPNN